MSEDSKRVRIILSTVDSEDEAGRLSREMVDRRLVACVNLIPGIRSVYRWKGEVVEEGEILLLMKTTAERVAECMTVLAELHSYDTPEIIVATPEDVAERYAAWVADNSTDS